MDTQIEKDTNTNNFELDTCLLAATYAGASDIHLHAGMPPIFRVNGLMEIQDAPILAEAELDSVINNILPKGLRNKLSYAYDLDFAYEVKDIARFRVNLSRQMGKTVLVLRVIPFVIKTLSELTLPLQLEAFVTFNSGIVLFTGPTGCGKSTTLASLIDLINTNFNKHIITIEDPVEFVYKNKNSIISQRQVGIDTESFHTGLKYALRQDPDMIVIGEIRDKETLTAALQAAETGHLVFATLHTNDAVATINRLISFYEPQDRNYIRQQLSTSLRGSISQRLISRIDKNGKIPACEIMLVTPTIQDLIRKNNFDSIYQLIKQGNFSEMLTLNYSLNLLVSSGVIFEKDALEASNRPAELKHMLKGVYHGSEK